MSEKNWSAGQLLLCLNLNKQNYSQTVLVLINFLMKKDILELAMLS